MVGNGDTEMLLENVLEEVVKMTNDMVHKQRRLSLMFIHIGNEISRKLYLKTLTLVCQENQTLFLSNDTMSSP